MQENIKIRGRRIENKNLSNIFGCGKESLSLCASGSLSLRTIECHGVKNTYSLILGLRIKYYLCVVLSVYGWKSKSMIGYGWSQ